MTRTDTATTALQQAHRLLAEAWSALEMGSGDDPDEPASNALIEARAAVNAAMRHLDATTTGDESRRIETAAERSAMRQEQADHDRDALHSMIRESGLGPRRLAELAGLSPQRIAQIKRGTRTW